MTASEVEASWGQPSQIRAERDMEVWSYDHYQIQLYFKNGVLEDWEPEQRGLILQEPRAAYPER